MRVILDTNVLLSGLISGGGIPIRLIEAWLDRRFVPISHALQLDEIREVSRREKLRGALIRPAEAGWLVTGNKDDLLALERHANTRIVSAAVLAEQLGI